MSGVDLNFRPFPTEYIYPQQPKDGRLPRSLSGLAPSVVDDLRARLRSTTRETIGALVDRNDAGHLWHDHARLTIQQVADLLALDVWQPPTRQDRRSAKDKLDHLDHVIRQRMRTNRANVREAGEKRFGTRTRDGAKKNDP